MDSPTKYSVARFTPPAIGKLASTKRAGCKPAAVIGTAKVCMTSIPFREHAGQVARIDGLRQERAGPEALAAGLIGIV